ncbi:MAG: hypothetical protein GY797_37080 [Deltaproteobacteria bacterium]|nr:hypothetical protein [Deltaproteobacteria bacterium]
MAETSEKKSITGQDGNFPELYSTGSANYRGEIIQTIDEYRRKIKTQIPDRKRIKNRLKLLQMKDEVQSSKDLSGIEKQLWSMSVDIEEPNLKMQRNISLVILFYTLLTFFGFISLTFSDRIMLPSFNIPYSVLLMGLIGNLVSMYVKLPNLRIRQPLSFDTTTWFIINPPIAVIMAGIFFGVVQVLLSIFKINISDESWTFWILAWVVGLINWVAFYEKLSDGFSKNSFKQKVIKTENVKVIKTENVVSS